MKPLKLISVTAVITLFVLFRLNGNLISKTSSSTSILRRARKPKKLPYCSRSQIQNGSWIESNESHPFSTPTSACQNPSYNINDTYEWQPREHETCEFAKWDKHKFCRVFKGAPILLVGDSLTFEHYEALVQSLGGNTTEKLHFISKFHNRTLIQSVCNDETVVMYRRQDNLKGLDQFLNETFPVVLVLNRGAHYVRDDRLATDLDETFQYVQNWLHRCHEYGIKCHFFWRTTVPGHPDCQNYTKPVNNILQMEQKIDNSGVAEIFKWQHFRRQNKLVLGMLLQQNSLLSNGQVLDAYPINILRPDQHARDIDCLHSCGPGKIDIYNRLLFHYMLQMRSMTDTKRLQEFNFPWNRTFNIIVNGEDVIEL